jgi:hypothetical protein
VAHSEANKAETGITELEYLQRYAASQVSSDEKPGKSNQNKSQAGK